MNERIKELGRKVGFAFIEDGVYGARWYSSRCGMDTVELEKFAELIVQECAKTIQEYVDHRIPASEYADRLRYDFS